MTVTTHRDTQLPHEDVRRLWEDIVDGKDAAIIASGGAPDQLEAYLAWVASEGDVMSEERKPLNGKGAELFDSLTAADAWDEPEQR